MKNLAKILFLSAFLINMAGCLSLEKQQAIKITPKGRHSFNFATSTETGELLLQSKPPSNQHGVTQYALAVDGRDPVKVYKYSDASFILDEGEHTLKLFALPTEVMSVFSPNKFGKAREEKITIYHDQTLVAEYTGPYSMFTDGSFEIIGERKHD